VVLLDAIAKKGHRETLGIVGKGDSPIGARVKSCYVLTAGAEKAVAATKTVVEQALFYDILFCVLNGRDTPDLRVLGDLFEETLQTPLSREIVEDLASAGTLFWAGRSDGVAAELSLKTNEITRKPSDFLEGTYAVHGIEEVMDAQDRLVVVRPFENEEEKIREVIVEGVGMKVYAIAAGDSHFPRIPVNACDPFSAYLELAAGWNILVEIGLEAGIDLDKPERARKVGNEFTEG
jgi:glucosamine--fructose-6-phosphate aminotransferase (isomerizing)